MAKSTTSLPNLPRPYNMDEVSVPSYLFPGLLSNKSPAKVKKPRKKYRKVTNIGYDNIASIVDKLKMLIKKSARDFRTDEIKKEVSTILPLLVQQNEENTNITDRELYALRNMIRLGASLVEIAKDIKNNRVLAEMLISIGESLQGM